MNDVNFTKIIIPTTPHPDVIIGIFFLKKFGTVKYPGIEYATVETMQHLPEGESPQELEQKGILALDVGHGKFDHHDKNTHLSYLIAKDLGVAEDTSLSKLLLYSERDDKFGLGTISQDSLDKAFGLSGLVAALNKNTSDPEKVIATVFPLIEAHYLEEKKRTQDLPVEFEKKLKEGKAEVFNLKQGSKKLKAVVIESDDASFPGWLRSIHGLKADIVCQRRSLGFTNIITKPLKKVDLRWVAAYLRDEEFKLKNKKAGPEETKTNIPISKLMSPGTIAEVPEWYYDRATNSVLNGGVNPKGIQSTQISLKRIREIIEEAIQR